MKNTKYIEKVDEVTRIERKNQVAMLNLLKR